MPSSIKKLLHWLAFGFVFYAILTLPVQAADFVSMIWSAAKGSVVNLGQFYSALVG